MRALKERRALLKAATQAEMMRAALNRRLAEMTKRLTEASTGSGFEDNAWDDYAFPPPPSREPLP